MYAALDVFPPTCSSYLNSFGAPCPHAHHLPPRPQEQHLCHPSAQAFVDTAHRIHCSRSHDGASAQPQQHHSRSFFISRFSSNTIPRSRYFPGQPWHHRLHTAAHQLPSRSHLSCLAVGETRSFLLVPRCQEGADGRCALPIILFLWYPACWQNSRSNIWRQEFAVYFQFWVTAKRHHGVQGEEERLILVFTGFCNKRNRKEKMILKKKKKEYLLKMFFIEVMGWPKRHNFLRRVLHDLLKGSDRGKPSGICTYSLFYSVFCGVNATKDTSLLKTDSHRFTCLFAVTKLGSANTGFPSSPLFSRTAASPLPMSLRKCVKLSAVLIILHVAWQGLPHFLLKNVPIFLRG